jgi:hypothetical protein
MRKTRKNSALYTWLEENNYLDSPERIVLGKKLYRRFYLREHKKSYRLTVSEHSVALKPHEKEIITQHASVNGMGEAEFIRLAALNYCAKTFLTPRNEAVISLQQQVILVRTHIARLAKEKPGMFGKSRDEKIEAALLSFEAMMKDAFKTPTDIEALITQALADNPLFIERLKSLVDAYKK